MYCLKCGKETESEAVFCGACLQSMEQYPVKPGTVIHLHRREVVEAQKKAPRPKRYTNAEEQVIYLKKILKFMGLLLLIAVAALGLCTGLLLTL